MLAVSRLNYPGAEALNRLHALATHDHDTAIVHVHMDTLACMTGITRFLQLPPPPAAVLDGAASPPAAAGAVDLFWVYDKTEDEDKLLDPVFWARFDYAVAERPERVIGKWEVVETVEAFAGFRVVRLGERKEGDNGNWASLKESVQRGAWGEGMVEVWELFERFGRKATGGWWVEVRMEPRVRVLRKQRKKPQSQNQVGGDW